MNRDNPLPVRRQLISLFTLLAFIANTVGLSLSASFSLSAAQAFTDESKTLICTGREMKWVDMPASVELGRFVFVDPPEALPKQYQHLKCASACLLDQVADLPVQNGLPVFVTYPPLSMPLLTAEYRQSTYSKALSRAPPLS